MKTANRILLYLLSFSFLLNLSIGTISNYSTIIFIEKAVSSFILLMLIIADLRINNIDLNKLIHKQGLKRLILIISAFVIYLSLTLTYSRDADYGAQKLLNFLLSAIPAMGAFYYLIATLNPEREKIIIRAMAALTIATLAYILIDYPFDQTTIYEYKPGRWSHVIYARLLGFIAITLIFYSLKLKNKKEIIFYSLISSLAVYAVYISAHRSALLGLIVIFLGIVGLMFSVQSSKFSVQSADGGSKFDRILFQYSKFNIRYSKSSIRRIASILSIPIVVLVLIFTIPKPGVVDERYSNLTETENSFEKDASINTRFESFRISKEMFLSDPIIGVGFGGYKAYNSFSEVVKYPHNIFLEMAAEGGVVGLLILSAILFLIIKFSFKYSFEFGMIAIYFLILAMFSKDISTQVYLWMFVSCTGLARPIFKNKTI